MPSWKDVPHDPPPHLPVRLPGLFDALLLPGLGAWEATPSSFLWVAAMTTPPLTGSVAEQTLAVQLEQAGIPFVREFAFARHLGRRWRADFKIDRWEAGTYPDLPFKYRPVLVEVEGGSYTGGHKRGKAYESDCDKQNAAMLAGWQVYRFTPAMVEDGRALAVIRQALGIERAA
jgi:hypothetical protein